MLMEYKSHKYRDCVFVDTMRDTAIVEGTNAVAVCSGLVREPLQIITILLQLLCGI